VTWRAAERMPARKPRRDILIVTILFDSIGMLVWWIPSSRTSALVGRGFPIMLSPGIGSLADVIEVQSAGTFSYGWISSVTWKRTINRFTVVLNQ